MSFVAGFVLKQPNIDDVFGIFFEIILLQAVDGPFDGVFGSALNVALLSSPMTTKGF